MITDYKILKAEIGLYKHYKKQYNSCLKKSEEIIDNLASLPSPNGVKTVKIKKRNKNGTVTVKEVPAPKLDYDPERAIKHRNEMIALSSDLEQEAYQYKQKIDDIDETLNHLPLWLKTKTINVYINRLGNKMAKECGESKTSFYRNLDKELIKFLKK